MKDKSQRGVGLELHVNPRAVPAELLRAFHKALRAGLEAMGETWVKEYLPKHFEAGAKARYHYAARSPRYERAKERRNGNTAPNVWSGRLELQLLGSAPTITATNTGLRVKFSNVPEYLYYRPAVADMQVYSALQQAGGNIKEAARLVGIKADNVVARTATIEAILVRRRLVAETFEKLHRDINRTAGALGMSKTMVGRDLAAGFAMRDYVSEVNKPRELTEVADDELGVLEGIVLRRVKRFQEGLASGPSVLAGKGTFVVGTTE